MKNRQVVTAVVDEAFDILGPASKKALLFYLHSHYISLENHDGGYATFTLEQLYHALQSILGIGGADLIIDNIILKMDELSRGSEKQSRPQAKA